MNKRPNSSVAILEAATEASNGDKHGPWSDELSFQAVGRTTDGAGTAVVQIQVSNVPEPTEDGHWLTAIEISLTDDKAIGDAGDVSDGQQIDACWRWVRAVVTEITGTGATVDVYMGG